MTLDEENIRRTVGGFIGDYNQIPPMYSALKVQGKKLYELARQGKTVEREARPVKIYEIEIEEISLPRIRLTVSCPRELISEPCAMISGKHWDAPGVWSS